jgi:hypothetical protein
MVLPGADNQKDFIFSWEKPSNLMPGTHNYFSKPVTKISCKRSGQYIYGVVYMLDQQ